MLSGAKISSWRRACTVCCRPCSIFPLRPIAIMPLCAMLRDRNCQKVQGPNRSGLCVRMEFPLPRYKKGLGPIRSSPVDRDILREGDSTRAGPTPIPKGKNTFAFTVEFAALYRPKIGARDKGDRPKTWPSSALWRAPRSAKRDPRNMSNASYLLHSTNANSSQECKHARRGSAEESQALPHVALCG